MSNRSLTGWLVAIVFLGVLVGVVGGGLMGGIVGYYVAVTRAPAAAPVSAIVTGQPEATPPPVAVNPAQLPAVTNLTVNQTSAVIETVKKVEPAVVTIINTLDSGRNISPSLSPQASGSGVIIDQQGHIVTNNHVVAGSLSLTVIFSDGSKQDAKIVGTDAVTDLAVIQVFGKVPAFATIGDSNALQLGETVIAIGSPLGSYRGSVTMGVVSGLNRSVEGTQQEGLIQTDAAINHGNSGGPLVNLAGQIVGINTLVVRDTQSGDVAEGLGFSIPSNMVRDVSQQLITKGKVEYPFIGITYREINPQLASQYGLPVPYGLYVTDIVRNSPADKGGIQLNDIIVSIDNNKIDEEHSLRSILYKYHAGDQITVQLMRQGQNISVKITLVLRPAGQ